MTDPTHSYGAAHDKGFCLWFTGLSGAGKTTISKLVEVELEQRRNRLEILDGDVVRENLSKGLGFSKEDRDTNIRRIAFVADLLSRNGVPVVTAAISPYAEIRAEAREMMGDRFIEVYVEASVETCAERDAKGLYAEGLRRRDQGVHRSLGSLSAAGESGDRLPHRGRGAPGVGGQAARLPRGARADPGRADRGGLLGELPPRQRP